MSFRLVSEGWGAELENALRRDRSEFKIVSPFIKYRALERLLELGPARVRVITRFSLDDFAKAVSDIEALRRMLDYGAAVRGIRSLHAKLYVFGHSAAVVTSANLTVAGLDANPEFGLVTEDPAAIRSCHAYFEDLWSRGGDDLLSDQVNRWAEEVTAHLASGAGRGGSLVLPDHGVDAGLPKLPQVAVPPVFSEAEQAIVKFHGRGHDRAPLSTTTLEEVDGSGCHWAVCYPRGKRPQSVRDRMIVFIARFTENPRDIRIFGRAVAMRHVVGRDDATDADVKVRSWKSDWPHYVRLHDAEFVNGTLQNGVSLGELMDTLWSDAFASTQKHAARGEGNTNPRLAIRQQPAARLSRQGYDWLNQRLQEAFDAHGTIPRSTLQQLDWPELP